MGESANQRVGEPVLSEAEGSVNGQDGTPPLPDGWVWTTIGEITQPIEKVKPRENPDARFTYLDISSIDNKSNRITEPKTYYGPVKKQLPGLVVAPEYSERYPNVVE